MIQYGLLRFTMKRILILVLAIIGVTIFSSIIFVATARILTPEDTWIPAKDWSASGGKNSTGQWVKHGNPIGGPPVK